jgi:hypothetical protein
MAAEWLPKSLVQVGTAWNGAVWSLGVSPVQRHILVWQGTARNRTGRARSGSLPGGFHPTEVGSALERRPPRRLAMRTASWRGKTTAVLACGLRW